MADRLTTADLHWRGDLPVSMRFGDAYASAEGALAEKRHVFLDNNDLPERWREARRFVIAELGFGTGLNFLAAWDLWRRSASAFARLDFISVEGYPLARQDLARALKPWSPLADLAGALLAAWPPAEPGFRRLVFDDGRVNLTLLLGDAREMLAELRAPVDTWFLDGFAPAVNPEMWCEMLLRRVAALTRPGGTFATYTAAGVVRRRLEAVGFQVEKFPGFGRKKEMMRGRLARACVGLPESPWFRMPRLPASTTRHAAVIGAGLAGTAVAQALAWRGWRITLVERHGEPAQEASGNAVGVLMPLLDAGRSPLQRWIAAGYRYTLGHLYGLGGVLEWSPCGVLLAGWDERSRRRQRAMMERLCIPSELLRPVGASQASSHCGMPVDWGGLYAPEGGWLNPPSLCRAQLESVAENVSLIQPREVFSLKRCDGSWTLLDVQGKGIVSAPVVVFAGGTDAARFDQTRGLPLVPVRGQMTALPATVHSRALRTVVCGPGYAIPARDGVHWVGATFDPGDRSPLPSGADDDRNRQLLRSFFPVLAHALAKVSAHGRVAFRAVSPDHLPLVGPVPDMAAFREAFRDLHRGFPASRYPPAPCQPGLYISAGYGSRGLSSAPLAAELLAGIIEGEPLPVERALVHWLHPARFMVRDLRKKAG